MTTNMMKELTRPLWPKILEFWQGPRIEFLAGFVLSWRLSSRLFICRQKCFILALKMKRSTRFYQNLHVVIYFKD